MSKLILIRHGQSEWNAQNKFTGWVDVDLSEQGVLEAKEAGNLIKKKKINIDISYTSYLKRAIRTLTTILDINKLGKKFNASWQINERHYGALTGLNKSETKQKIGEEKFNNYRRSWSIAPPPIEDKDGFQKKYGPLNLSLPEKFIPLTESLEDTYNHVIPYYVKEIKGNLANNKNILISAHGNSLRALCKYLFNIKNSKINELEIPTGNPLVLEIEDGEKIKECYYLDLNRKKEIFFN